MLLQSHVAQFWYVHNSLLCKMRQHIISFLLLAHLSIRLPFIYHRSLRKTTNMEEKLFLSYNHRSLASQSPLQWALNNSTRAAAELAVRKVMYRALFGKLAAISSSAKMTAASTDDNHEPHGKIGRLRDSAYASFDLFLVHVNKKLGTDVPILSRQW